MPVAAVLTVAACSSPIGGTALPQEPADDRPRSTSQAALSRARGTFDSFKAAVIERAGWDVAALAADTAYDYYETARGLALRGLEEQIDGVSVSMRLTVFLFRAEVDVSTLKQRSAYDLIAIAFGKGFLGAPVMRSIELGKIEMSGRTAYAEVIIDGTAVPITIEFQFDGANWKIDLPSFFRIVNWALSASAEKQGMTVSQLIDQTLIKVYGVVKARELRKPLLR